MLHALRRGFHKARPHDAGQHVTMPGQYRALKKQPQALAARGTLGPAALHV